ncbi:hypothetical protein BV25DRAFT_1308528 [Artomyces pyxidatus]|uniref:Uncharacterized protein n=1 Tax=Artomyces pyxidatus TaxID=48021 RepID=A0ACB8SNA8_9AGAM|nr:hypothetical protein BV25DRAFT_1308528 [Artomyces pyxidatus]
MVLTRVVSCFPDHHDPLDGITATSTTPNPVCSTRTCSVGSLVTPSAWGRLGTLVSCASRGSVDLSADAIGVLALAVAVAWLLMYWLTAMVTVSRLWYTRRFSALYACH